VASEERGQGLAIPGWIEEDHRMHEIAGQVPYDAKKKGALPVHGLLQHDLEPQERVLPGLPAGHRPDDRF
jgi:hypothetical protein